MFRILAIDGGGARGIFPAHILALFSKQHGSDLSKTFDLIVGTSTGAIIAAAAATGVPMERVVQLYEQNAKDIFHPKALSLRGLLRSKYGSRALRTVLTEVLGTGTMADVSTRLVLPATDISNGNVFVIKSPYLTSFVRDRDIPLVDAVMASCAAPSYFDPVRIGEYLLADGGLWASNPSLVAYTEAVGKLAVNKDDVRILSLGAGVGHQFYDIGNPPRDWGIFSGWGATRLVDTFLNLQSRSSSNSAMLLLGDKYLRINFEESGPLPLDVIDQMPRFKSRAGEEFTYKSQVIKGFLQL